MSDSGIGIEPTSDLFRGIVETLPHMLWVCRGEDGACVYLSPQWAEYTGIPAEEQLGYRWLDQLHPEDVETTKQRWTEAAEAGTSFDTEFRIRKSDKTYRWFKTRARPVFGEKGKISHWVGSNTDITTLRDVRESAEVLNRQLEQRVVTRTRELEISKAKLETVATQLQTAQRITRVGSWELDIETNQVTWSEELFRVFQLDPQETPPGYDQQRHMFTEESWERLTSAISRSVETGEGYELTLDIFRKNGELATSIARAETMRNPEGKVERLVGTFQDITERERTSLKLRELTERLQLATSAARMGVWDWNVKENELLWDEGMHRLYGTDPNNFPGAYEAWTTALHPDDKADAISQIELTVAKGEPFDTVFRIVRPDGRTLHIRALAEVYFDEHGEALRLVGVNWDITEGQEAALQLREQERRLRELNELLEARTQQAESANRAKSLFVASMSHEIRTPLGAILGLAYLLRRTELSEKQDGLLGTVESSAKTLLGMVNDILDLSKIEAGELTLESSPFRVDELAEELSGLMSGYALGKPITCEVEVDEALPHFLAGDRVRIMQVLTNLVGNAIKFTEQGRVHVSLALASEQDSRRLRCEVRDTGCGISADFTGSIFKPFTQVSGVGSRPGTGLGLAISRELVSRMDGQIGLESTLGEGSLFWFEIPLLEAELDGELRKQSPLHVLFVEEKEEARAVLLEGARKLGWSFVSATSGAEALTLLTELAPTARHLDAIIVNRKLSGMDGLQLASAVRQQFGLLGKSWAIVTVTDQERETVLEEDGSQLVDSVVTLPMSTPKLLNGVVQALSQRPGTSARLDAALRDAAGIQRLPELTILVVDDSEVNRDIACHILELEGARTKQASDGDEALDILRKDPQGFDAVLMDVQMPRIDGIEAVRQIRSDLHLLDLPVVALTAGALATEREMAVKAGMSDFITKPFDPGRLVATVRRRVEQSRRKPVPDKLGRTKAQPLSWPVLAGFDAREARARFGGDVEFYCRALEKFRNELACSFAELSDDRPPAELVKRLHKLRGAAGNLGAVDLQKLACSAETKFRENQPIEEGELSRLMEEQRRALDAITHCLTTTSRPPSQQQKD